MRKIDQFTNKYSVSKTLRFRLIPMGVTEEYFRNSILEGDLLLADRYDKMKEIIKRYHRDYIERCLSSFEFGDPIGYYEAYCAQMKESKGQLDEGKEKSFRANLHTALTKSEEYKLMGGDKLIKELLPNFVTSEEEKEIVSSFSNFSTYFEGFKTNLKNFYTNEDKDTEIITRTSENLRRAMNNCMLAEKNDYQTLFGDSMIFSAKNLNLAIAQSGIDKYNEELGKINQAVNEYCQKNKCKLPQLKKLDKQILSERESSFVLPQAFDNDEEVLNAIVSCYHEFVQDSVACLKDLFVRLQELSPVYVEKLEDISTFLFKNWEYLKEQKKILKTSYFSLNQIQELYQNEFESENTVFSLIQEKVQQMILSVEKGQAEFEAFLKKEQFNLLNDVEGKAVIKSFLDAIKDLQSFLSIFYGMFPMDANLDFYSIFDANYEKLTAIIPIYNKTRNYLTKKPFSEEKIKLTFGNSQLLNGWDENKESAYLTVLLRKGGLYYLAIMDKKNNKLFSKMPKVETGEEVYEKMVYKYLPGPNKMLPKVFFSEKNKKIFQPTSEYCELYKKGTFKKGKNFNLDDCHKMIDYFKWAISVHEDWKTFGFEFSPTESYSDISEFYREVANQGYKVTFKDVSASYIDEMVKQGKLYLFQLYNKDFSEYSHGKKNLHTLYFNALFSKENLKQNSVVLNGSGEMFFRKKSLPRKITHPKNQPIDNKNPIDGKKQSVFEYDLIKNNRYTFDQFFLHTPITLNFIAEGKAYINKEVQKAIVNCDNNYVIGIDRGERNLLYISVVDEKGNIVEQRSMNVIGNRDYHDLLKKKGAERVRQRKDWQQIGDIKNVKQGYLSFVIHEICNLIEKYDAVIAMEDLNNRFKEIRSAVEASVYQQFEKALIDKMNYMSSKDKQASECGGIVNGYQLTEQFDSFEKMRSQNGFIFYVPAWMTSKIDPTTGFVDLIKPKYENESKAKAFFQKFDRIWYDEENDYFCFDVDLSNFQKTNASFRKQWTVCTYGDRIASYQKKETGQWDYRVVHMTQELKDLFKKYGIDYRSERLQESICEAKGKEFFYSLMWLLRMTLQMRNSVSTQEKEIDYLISPVKNKDGVFFDTRNVDKSLIPSLFPVDADANGAYNIARKAQWIIRRLKNGEKFCVPNQAEWLAYAQMQ